MSAGMAQKNAAEEPTEAALSKAWSGFQAGGIGLFWQLSRIFDQSLSNAKIHGALFMALSS
jgi:hypothetical protein